MPNFPRLRREFSNLSLKHNNTPLYTFLMTNLLLVSQKISKTEKKNCIFREQSLSLTRIGVEGNQQGYEICWGMKFFGSFMLGYETKNDIKKETSIAYLK